MPAWIIGLWTIVKILITWGPGVITLVKELVELVSKLRSPAARDAAAVEAVRIATLPTLSRAERRKRFKDFACRLRNDCAAGL